MPEEPEKVLPENRGTTILRIEKVGPGIAIEQEHHLRGGQGREGDDDQHRIHHKNVDEERHFGEQHTGCPHRENGRQQVHPEGNRAGPGEHRAENPIVGGIAAGVGRER